ncbi:MAG: PAS domain-containing protein [Robiginitomaculum sp.]|nr:PAS domain-containing protein [Robiginitomaculum sp.]MDQ7076796.1 PAS domain-containing protein [Robiginitomaculum sp.]
MTSVSLQSPISQRASGAFTLHHADGCHYLFGWTGKWLRQLSGRALRDHDFISLWRPADRAFLQAQLDDVRRFGRTRTIKARAVTLGGESRLCSFEFTKLKHPLGRGATMGCRWRTSANANMPGTPIAELRLDTPPTH